MSKWYIASLYFRGALLVFGAGYLTGDRLMKNEAIQNGLAEWRIDKDHNISFYWYRVLPPLPNKR